MASGVGPSYGGSRLMSHRCGVYRAVVANVSDPLGQGRIQVFCPQLWGTSVSDWVPGCWPPNLFQISHNASAGTADPSYVAPMPVVNQQVWLTFEAGDEDYPVWLGTPHPGGMP